MYAAKSGSMAAVMLLLDAGEPLQVGLPDWSYIGARSTALNDALSSVSSR
jgi:hypothetical protein